MDTSSNKKHFPALTAAEYAKAIRDNFTPFAFHYDIVEKIQQKHTKRMVDKHETILIEALAKSGYKFTNQQELIKFAKERCELVREDNKRCALLVDGKEVVEWWDTVRFEQNGNTFTAIMGEKPE